MLASTLNFFYKLPSSNEFVDDEMHSVELDPIDTSIKQLKVYITGILAFYATILGKPNTSNSQCIWCDLRPKFLGMKEMLTSASKWTIEKLKAAKARYDFRTSRSRAKTHKTEKGVSASPLITAVEPEDIMFPVLHDQIGLVNKSLDHMVAYVEKHVEKLGDGHAKTRKDLLAAEKATEQALDELDQSAVSTKDLEETMDLYEQLYGLLDKIFSDLRKILPSEEELVDLEDAIKYARVIWIERLQISCTPKAHALFDGHALEQHKRVEGLGDKTEDFVEHGHQLGLRDERRTWNIRNFEACQRSQIRNTRRRNQPIINDIIVQVTEGRKRKNVKRLANGGLSIKEEKKKVKSEEQRDQRMKNLDDCRRDIDNSGAFL